jgi:hypothetical protein
MTPRVSWAQALAWRMERHLLTGEGAADPVGVVRRLCAVQAQVPSSAELAVRVRMQRADGTATAVAAALDDGRLIRTWAMRGTLHLMAAADAGIYLALLTAGRLWHKPAWERWAGMTPEVVERMRDATRDALNGRVLSREQLITAITAWPGLAHLDEPLRESWGTALKPLAFQGDLAIVPGENGRAAFRRPDASRHWRGLPPEEEAVPLAIVAYLRAYGPATAEQFHAWLAQWAIGKRQVRRWWVETHDRMASVQVDGEEAWVATEDLDELLATPPTRALRLLPGFDQWVLGPGTTDPHVLPRARRWMVSRQSGWIAPLVVAGGVVRGTWQLDGGTVRVAWFAEAGRPPRRAIAAQVDALGDVLGRELGVEVATVPA